MKKIIAALATMLFAISFVFGATGCNGNKTQQPSEDNASITQQPQPAPDTDSDAEPDTGTETGSKPQPTPGTKPSLTPRPKYAAFYEFEEFKNYYETEFAAINSEKFYLLYPEMESVNGCNPSYFRLEGDWTFNEDEPFINPRISECFHIFSEEFVSGLSGSQLGSPPHILEVDVDLKVLPENHVKTHNFTFEFSKYTGQFKWHFTVKIFENEILIAECNYDQRVEVPHSWIEEYFTNNLI